MYVNVNIFDEEHIAINKKLKALPISCDASADFLKKESDFYQKEGVFPKGTIDAFVKKLKAYKDKNLSERLYNKKEETKKLVDTYLHCM